MKSTILLILAAILTAEAHAPAPRYAHSIASRAEFDRLSRTYYSGRFTALPHLMAIIDRTGREPGRRVYYADSKLYSFHSEFVSANYLSLERGREFFRRNYIEPNRRFILATIVYRERAGKFSFELWEGDEAGAELLREAWEAIGKTFYAPVFFKPNSVRQEKAAEAAGIPRLTPSEIDPAGDYQALNIAKNAGVLRIVERMTPGTIIDRNEIVIFIEPPLTLTPLSGVITTSFSTPLSHVNLLTRGWEIPNAYIRGAAELYRGLAGRYVLFETRPDGYTLRPADQAETLEYGRRLARRSDLLTPDADTDFLELTPLDRQRRSDSVRFGAKSANLGELTRAVRAGRLAGVSIPAGFTIPFGHYQKFIEGNGIDRTILEMLGNDRFNHDAAYRKQQLARLRETIARAPIDPALVSRAADLRRRIAGKGGVFVRSSTNSEDLPNFSGAGLYTTVPNVVRDEDLPDAIRTVWASLWNYEAYEARESFGINHSAVYPAVLIQAGIEADAAGVLITANPFDRRDRRSIYINAKRGLGIRVVEGRGVPEQLLCNPSTGRVRVLTRSLDDTMLTFDPSGGIRPVTIETGRAVLGDPIVRRLSAAALAISKIFSGRTQDIEWLIAGNRIHIVQSRPYVAR